MAKRKFGFEGFGIARQQPTFTFEPAPAAPRRLPIPIPSAPRPPHDHYEDHDVDNIEFDDDELHRLHQESEPTLDRNSSHHLEPEEEIDPLDAFMEGIHEEVKKAPVQAKSKMDDLEDEEDDPVESFLKARRDAGLSLAAEALHAGYDSDEEVYAAAKAVDAGLVEYDSDDNPIITLDRRKIEPLPPLDHSDIDYGSFSKDFYDEKTSISGMSEEEVASYRNSLAIKVSGFDVPRPVKEFDNLAFNALLAGAISKQGYERPTPIQCQALPVALSGRDMIGIAKTGSGKTAAFVLPMIVHILDQEELDKGEGPIGVICAPTRELAQQIYTETKKFAKPHGIRVSGIFGGMSKFDQFKELKAGCEVVIATPGRLIDMLKMKALTMLRATYLVLDEADRMFDLGFEPQIRSIVGQIRPDRQTLLFSATMPKRVERLAREILSDPVRIAVGEVGSANEDITQIVTVIPSDDEKLPWLYNRLPEMVDEGDVLVFVSTKLKVEDVENRLTEKGFKVAALHGDKDQASRMEVLQKFKSGIYHVLVATDVASRGLDIKSIKSVVNFDIAKDMDSHVHRIGRTGRAGDKDGVAYTLITHKEARFAGELVNSLIAAGQTVPVELMDLAMKDSRFRARREERKGGKKGGARGRTKGNSTGSGGGRMVRGVDFGMGIGYKRETDNKAFQVTGKTEIPNRGAAVDALKTGMMARFKSSFVAASVGNVQGSATNVPTANQQSSSPYQRRTLGGVGYGNGKGPSLSAFVSGGSIGGVSHNQASGGMVGFSSAATAPTADHSPYALQSGRSLDVAGDLKAGGQDAEHDREISRWGRGNSHHVKPGDSKEQSHASGQERSRERRRPSGWDR